MKKKTIQYAFILSVVVLLLSIVIDQFLLQKPILAKPLGLVFSGYLGSVVYTWKPKYKSAFFYGFLLGLLFQLFFFSLVLFRLIPVPSEISTRLSTYSFTGQLSIYTAAIILGGLATGFYSFLGAWGAKLFWKSKTKTQK